MRHFLHVLPLMLAPILLSACNQQADKSADQPNMVSNIIDQAMPDVGNAQPSSNAITPVEAPSRVDAAPPATAPAGLVPARLQGNWTGVNDSCGDRSANLELTIAPDRLVFHESVGAVKSVSDGADGRVSVDAAFTGEGQSWTRTVGMQLSADGKTLTIVNDGTAVTRKRC